MKGKLKYLFLFFFNCGNDHLRGRSDYHFIYRANNECPKLKIKFKKVSSGDLFITQLVESDSNRKQSDSNKECSLSLEMREDDNSKEVLHEKEIKIIDSNDNEYSVKINFAIQYQLLNFDIGLGKIYHLKNISTDLPDADIKTDFKNKILYNTYSNENVVEIEY